MSLPDGDAPGAVVIGCAGPELTPREAALFRAADPFGFILFSRNCQSPEQVGTLVRQLRDSVGRADAPVLIDQEGGSVQRLRPPRWHALPAAARIGALYWRNPERAREAVQLAGRLAGAQLAPLGITVDCAPVLDLTYPNTTAAIRTRSFAAEPGVVADLAGAFCEGLLQAGVLPVLKHLPGHGRATIDSHRAAPRVAAALTELRARDFVPFRMLSTMPLGMVAHVVYEAVDRAHVATVSRAVIGDVIRGEIGFTGFLFSDDICMGAMDGAMGARVGAALAAGCDAVLHCSGELAEMREVVAAAPPLSAAARARWQAAHTRLHPPAPVDGDELAARLNALTGRVGSVG